jgi:hypothetical protein
MSIVRVEVPPPPRRKTPPAEEPSGDAKSLEAFPLGSISPTGSFLPLIPKIKTHLYASTLPVCVMSIAEVLVDLAADAVEEAYAMRGLYDYQAARERLKNAVDDLNSARAVELTLQVLTDDIDIIWLGIDE